MSAEQQPNNAPNDADITDRTQWLTEACVADGSAFSFVLEEKLHEEQSAFQKVEVYKTHQYGNVMLIDGYVMVTERDNFLYHEMLTHVPLYAHPAPKKVVIIGGGDCGTLREVLRHDEVEEAWQIEIDEAVTNAARTYFPELTSSNDDPRANLYFGDGIQWMQDAPADSVDVIIVDGTDPVGPGEGLFRLPFYQQCHRVLREGGIVIQQSESPLYHLDLLKKVYSYMRTAQFTDARTIQFPMPTYPSGWWTATMAVKGTSLAKCRLTEERPPFATQYYTRNIHHAAFAMPAFFEDALYNVEGD